MATPADDPASAPLFPLEEAVVPWRALEGDFVGAAECEGQPMLRVDPTALEALAREAFRDSAHLLRPGHLAQLRAILDDPEASPNDRFVALDLLRNASIAAEGVLPMCQDTGTAIVMGWKGQQVWTGGGDEAALARGIRRTYAETNLRYSQLAPFGMTEEKNTGTNLPAQIDLYADDGDEYHFLFMAKGGDPRTRPFCSKPHRPCCAKICCSSFSRRRFANSAPRLVRPITLRWWSAALRPRCA